MEFRLLGGVEARSGADPVDLGPVRQRSVLAALLVDVNRTVSADRLVLRVWGDGPPRRAKDTLYSYLSRLRRALSGAAALSHRHGGYAIAADELAVDMHRFRHLLGQARAAGDDASAMESFRQALALWRGEPFEGIDTPWFNAAREALVTERLAADLDCADLRLRLGDHAALLPVLSERSTAHPLDERIAAQYMLALYRCGRQADALAHYRRVRATLADELGIDPGPGLQRLHEAVLAGALEPGPRPAVASAAAPAPVADPVSAYPPVSDWTVQCQLPLDTPGFVGRAALIPHLEEELAASAATSATAAAPVVLSGSPGVGKTALAVHVGHRLRAAFPDGQWYACLSGNGDRPPRDPAEVLSSLLLASGLAPHTVPESLEDRAAAFRSRLADRRVLLVLDDAADAEQMRPLLPGTAGAAVLVTSRSDLRGLTASHAARTVPLDVLAPAEAHALLDGTLGAGRVREEPEGAARLAELCARLPLALRIAAANLAARPDRSLLSYATELAADGRLAKLSVAGDRQAAVRTAFDRSYAALEPEAARLFRLLGLHPGPDFTAEAAAALLDAPRPEAERLLDRLTTAGLVQHATADRYQFHDLLRLYAAEHAADAPDRAAAWHRLCDWYLATTDAATAFDYTSSAQLPRTRSRSTRFDDRHEALAWLEAERAGLAALVLRTADAGPREISWQLADQLSIYLYARRHTTDWENTTTAALRAAEHDGETLAQAVLWGSITLMRQHAGDTEGTREALHRAQEGYQQAGFAPGEVSILTNLAIHYAQRGEMRRALDCQQSGYPLLRALDQPVLLARAFNIMGAIHGWLGEFDRAVDLATEAIETSREHDRSPGTISPLINRAVARHGLGHYAEARADGTEALRLCRHHRHRMSEAAAHEILARVNRDTRRLDLARTHAEQGLRTAREVGDRAHEAGCLTTLGAVHPLDGHPDLAIAHLHEALDLTRRCGLRHQEAEAHVEIARVHLAVGSVPAATHHAEQALSLARALELRPLEHRALTALAAAAHATGTADDHTAQARRIQAETGFHPPPADGPDPHTGRAPITP